MASSSGNNDQSALSRRPSCSAATTTYSMEVFDNEVVPSSLQSITPILRVAAEIQNERPRVAYLCRYYAFGEANILDQNSSGHGVRQFKTSLQQRLERDNTTTLASRVKKSDAREIESFYKQYCEQYGVPLNKGEQADRAQLGKAYQTADVLFEVLCAVNKTEKVEEVAPEIMAAANDVQANREISAPYNILPLDSAGGSQAIMQLDEGAALWRRFVNSEKPYEKELEDDQRVDYSDPIPGYIGGAGIGSPSKLLSSSSASPKHSGYGRRLMKNMGFDESKGLGKNLQGILSPLEVKLHEAGEE